MNLPPELRSYTGWDKISERARGNWRHDGGEEDGAENRKEAYTEAKPGVLFKPIFYQFC